MYNSICVSENVLALQRYSINDEFTEGNLYSSKVSSESITPLEFEVLN
jgi:hypothetical protein